MTRWAGVVLCLALLSCATNPAPSPRDLVQRVYRIGPPDQLFVSILPEPVIERDVTVRPDGKITVDLIGDVQAGGRTAEEVAQDIQVRIGRYKRDANATVFVRQARSDSITVFGEVRAPGTFPVERNTRVAEAIGMRGGETIFASKGRVRVIRNRGDQPEVFRVDLGDIQKGDLSTNIMLSQGDIVVVPPTAVARVGYFLQSLLFPFQQVLNTGVGAVGAWGAVAAF